MSSKENDGKRKAGKDLISNKPRANSKPNPSIRKVSVLTDDGYTFYCDLEALMVSKVLKINFEGYDGKSDPKPLLIPGFDHDVVQRVLWWMENHREDTQLKDNDPIEDTMDAWQRCFFRCTIDIIVKLISAANYLDIKRLMVLGINKLAEIIDTKMNEENPVQAIRDIFHIKAPEKREKLLSEDISQLFVFEKTIKSMEKPSKIDVLEVEVTHLPPRQLEPPDITE